MSKRILLLHGPNLNLLGQRDASMYGTMTLPELERAVQARASELDVEVECLQSNVEGELVNALHDAQGTCACDTGQIGWWERLHNHKAGPRGG